MKIDIYNDGIGYVTNEVSSIKPYEANLSEENRIKFVTDLAAISRGKTSSNNPKKRYKALLEEAALKTPSRPLEFLPVVLNVQAYYDNLLHTTLVIIKDFNLNEITYYKYDEFHNHFGGSFGYLNSKGYLFTNMRACINAGIPYEKIPYATNENIELYKNFKAIRAKVPMFVFNHLVTHTQLSKEARSERVVSLKGNDYWLPEDFGERLKEYTHLHSDKDIWDLKEVQSRESLINILLNIGQIRVQEIFKELGYKKEIYQRAMLELRYKELVITGWYNNPKTWKHLFLERNATNEWSNWTQKETQLAVKAIKQAILLEV